MIKPNLTQSTKTISAVDSCALFIQRLIFPLRCQLCLAPGEAGLDLCAACADDLPWLHSACHRCGEPLPKARGTQVCGACLKHPPPFLHSHMPFRYAFPIDRLVSALKYQGKRPPARLLGELLAHSLLQSPTFEPPDLIIPVPLHPKRLRERGFNQAQEIGLALQRLLGIPLAVTSVQRVRYTEPQQQLSASARRANLKGAFRATSSLSGQRVALLDDVMTTGTTLNQLAEVCLAAGAESVRCWCVARTPPQT